ncbi:MAG: RNA repair domain-containing protein [Desulfurococcales archaeon]|nr:RNA repair domain-containing protein [Desulfurococcales archaeon]
MAKRRSDIRSAINKFRFRRDGKIYYVVYIDRDPLMGERLSKVPLIRVVKVTGWAVYLDDGDTVIPLHRIVEVRDERGAVVWRRKGWL